jgi:hypothetical protein
MQHLILTKPELEQFQGQDEGIIAALSTMLPGVRVIILHGVSSACVVETNGDEPPLLPDEDEGLTFEEIEKKEGWPE